MGEMEHGRWIVQRLSTGWKYAREKDEEKKMSPYLVPWTELSEEVRKWDLDFVSKWPQLLAQAGLEVFDALKHPQKPKMSSGNKKTRRRKIKP